MYTLNRPDASDLTRIRDAVACWQSDGEPIRLHPGDLGWFSLRGAEATAEALRLWSTGERIVAVSLLDGPQLLRFAMDPALVDDTDLAAQIVSDVESAEAGVLDPGSAAIEERGMPALDAALAAAGWGPDEPWTPLVRDLSTAVDLDEEDRAGLRFIALSLDDTEDWARTHWSAFRGTPITEVGLRRLAGGWQRVAAETPLASFADSVRIISGVDPNGVTAAVVAVWSAGPGRPGLIEPMAVHEDHRGRGYGRAITVAGASALQEMDASSALVCTEAERTGAIATYTSAGFTAGPDIRDRARE